MQRGFRLTEFLTHCKFTCFHLIVVIADGALSALRQRWHGRHNRVVPLGVTCSLQRWR